MDTVVVAVGGSILTPAKPDPEAMERLARAVAGWSREVRLYVVAGGGRPAREAIAAARKLCSDEEELDRVGIAATRLNAQTLMASLTGLGIVVNDEIPTRADEVADMRPLVVMGGTTPGHSTDHVAADVARTVGADRVVIATNVDGVYSSDPREDPGASRFETMTYDQLKAITGTQWGKAGQAGVVDGPATLLLAELGIPCAVASGQDLDNLRNAVVGEAFTGTRIGAS